MLDKLNRVCVLHTASAINSNSSTSYRVVGLIHIVKSIRNCRSWCETRISSYRRRQRHGRLVTSRPLYKSSTRRLQFSLSRIYAGWIIDRMGRYALDSSWTTSSSRGDVTFSFFLFFSFFRREMINCLRSSHVSFVDRTNGRISNLWFHTN